MRSWHIIAASAVAATIAGAFAVLPAALPWRNETPALLIGHGPAIGLVWLSIYGIAALALTTLAGFLDVGSATRRSAPDGRVRRYFVQLAVTQYFTSVLALLALGLLR